MLCTYDYQKAYSYTFFFIVTGFGIPLAAIIFSYISIFKFALATKRELEEVTKKKTDKNDKNPVIDASDMRLLKSILTILAVFLFMWSPYAIIVVFDKNATWSRGLYVVAVVMAHLNSSINSIVYAATNKNFREGYWHLLSIFFCSFCKIQRRRKEDEFSSSKTDGSVIMTTVS